MLRSFVHTSVERIEVTAIPLQWAIVEGGRHEDRDFMPQYRRSVSVTRAETLAALRELVGIHSFDELIDKNSKYGKNQRSEAFSRVYFNDKKPGLDAFLEAIGAD